MKHEIECYFKALAVEKIFRKELHELSLRRTVTKRLHAELYQMMDRATQKVLQDLIEKGLIKEV